MAARTGLYQQYDYDDNEYLHIATNSEWNADKLGNHLRCIRIGPNVAINQYIALA
jgi:hypothetical protein